MKYKNIETYIKEAVKEFVETNAELSISDRKLLKEICGERDVLLDGPMIARLNMEKDGQLPLAKSEQEFKNIIIKGVLSPQFLDLEKDFTEAFTEKLVQEKALRKGMLKWSEKDFEHKKFCKSIVKKIAGLIGDNAPLVSFSIKKEDKAFGGYKVGILYLPEYLAEIRDPLKVIYAIVHEQVAHGRATSGNYGGERPLADTMLLRNNVFISYKKAEGANDLGYLSQPLEVHAKHIADVFKAKFIELASEIPIRSPHANNLAELCKIRAGKEWISTKDGKEEMISYISDPDTVIPVKVTGKNANAEDPPTKLSELHKKMLLKILGAAGPGRNNDSPRIR